MLIAYFLDVQSLIILHIFCKVGWATNDAVTQLKIVDLGLGREDLAIVVLIDFPIQIIVGWLVAQWSKGHRPLRPWLWATWWRLAFAFLAAVMVYLFPRPPISNLFFLLIIIHTVIQSIAT